MKQKTKQHILIASPYFYPEGGGLEKYALAMAKALAKNNKVTVVCATRGESRTEKIQGITVIRRHPSFFISNTPIDLKLRAQLNDIIEENKITIINAHTPVPFYADEACVVAKKRNLPFILNYHSSSLYKKRPFLDLIAFFYEKIFEPRLFSYAKAILFDSKFALDLKGPAGKSILLVPPVNTNLFRPAGNPTKTILFAGQLSRAHAWKGLSQLLKAFAEFAHAHPDYTLQVAGDGDMMQHYKNLAKKLNLEKKVTFLGKCDAKHLAKLYRKCYCVAVPSTSDVEGTPTVMLEAISCGKPIIGGKAGGIPLFIKENKCGLLVDANNAEQIASALDKIVEDKDLYNSLVKKCLDSTDKYREEVFVQKINEIFSKLL